MMFFERMIGRRSTDHFVAVLRIGYGAVFFCLNIYPTRVPDWLKSGILAGTLTTIMAGIGVRLHEAQVFALLAVLFVYAAGSVLLHSMKKAWYHGFALGLSLAGDLIDL
ncbi:MAG TPA: hypothetical protein GXZ64_05345 [Clostridiaceae bacterium]|nr:hypothetical protein [Clostridiaceae bacterium]